MARNRTKKSRKIDNKQNTQEKFKIQFPISAKSIKHDFSLHINTSSVNLNNVKEPFLRGEQTTPRFSPVVMIFLKHLVK